MFQSQSSAALYSKIQFSLSGDVLKKFRLAMFSFPTEHVAADRLWNNFFASSENCERENLEFPRKCCQWGFLGQSSWLASNLVEKPPHGERAVRDTAETLIAQRHVEPHSTSFRWTAINWRQLSIPQRLSSALVAGTYIERAKHSRKIKTHSSP